MKDQLYLLKPDFSDQGAGPFFCPESALIEGMLSFYPVLKEKIEVYYIDFQKPRKVIVSLLGLDNQGVPKLILGDPNQNIPPEVKTNTANGRILIANDIEICRYLASTYGCGMPHS
jgi:Protein of unknown function (DUF3088)